MNKQRKVVLTITYNEMGIIIDTKAEELGSSAQPERKRGTWIDSDIEDAWPYCSECGEMAIEKYDFCPECGARMEEGDTNG